MRPGGEQVGLAELVRSVEKMGVAVDGCRHQAQAVNVATTALPNVAIRSPITARLARGGSATARPKPRANQRNLQPVRGAASVKAAAPPPEVPAIDHPVGPSGGSKARYLATPP